MMLTRDDKQWPVRYCEQDGVYDEAWDWYFWHIYTKPLLEPKP